MSLKYFIVLNILFMHAQEPLIVFHPHTSNRVIGDNYEWALTYKAASLAHSICEGYNSEYACLITPLTYRKTDVYHTISFINTCQPMYCFIISMYEYKEGIAAVRLYTPCYHESCRPLYNTSNLSFISYQYGYQQSFFKTQQLVTTLHETLLSTTSLFEVLPYKKAPLKIAIGLQTPTVLIEIGISSIDNLHSIMTSIVQSILKAVQTL